jgi:hypothetical protein
MTAAAVFVAETRKPSSSVAFGNLIDLARLQAGTSAEICEACSTINTGCALFCKCCSHKLPAFYAARRNSGAQVPPPKPPRDISKRAWAMDFVAFWIVINSLVFITKFIPIP